MEGKRVRSAKGRALLLTAAVAVAALFAVPAHAANTLAAGTVAFGGLGADGFLTANDVVTDAPSPSVPVFWKSPGAAYDDADDVTSWSFTDASNSIPSAGGLCGPSTLSTSSSIADEGYLNTTCYNAFPDGSTINWVVTWHDTAGIAPDITKTASLVKDVTAPATPVIGAPAQGALYNSTARSLPVFSGTSDPFASVSLYDMDAKPKPALLTTTDTPKKPAVATADKNGVWSINVDIRSMGSGTHHVTAQVSDAAGNVSVTPVRVFDLDVDQPVSEIDSPANQSLFSSNDQIIVSGLASDVSKGNGYEGVTAVQVNVYNPASVKLGQAGASPVIVGSYVFQDLHATCTGCAPPSDRSGLGSSVSYSIDLSFLGPGSYTVNVVPYDKSGNPAAQPSTVNFIKYL